MKNFINNALIKIDTFGKKHGIEHLTETIIGMALTLPLMKAFGFLYTLAAIADNM